jgi:hypothetical protein
MHVISMSWASLMNTLSVLMIQGYINDVVCGKTIQSFDIYMLYSEGVQESWTSISFLVFLRKSWGTQGESGSHICPGANINENVSWTVLWACWGCCWWCVWCYILMIIMFLGSLLSARSLVRLLSLDISSQHHSMASLHWLTVHRGIPLDKTTGSIQPPSFHFFVFVL